MAKLMVFRGKERGDIPYYTAKSLASNQFTVAVVDNSYSKDLFESVHQYSDEKNFVEKENMVYLKDAELTDDFIDKFDYVIYYYGQNNDLVETDYTFFISDYTNTCIKNVKDVREDANGKIYLLLRDKVNRQIKEKNILEILRIDEESLIGFIPLDLKDEIGYQNFNYNGRQRIKDLSEAMQYAVMSIVLIVTEEKLKEVKNYYKKAKRNMHF